MKRKMLESGRYERVNPSHSWNSNNIGTNVLLYHLQRHSDHHANPTRRYQALRDFKEAPVLPTGYAGMIVLTWVPAIWRRVMDPRVVAHYDGDVSRANLHPRTAAEVPREVPPGGGARRPPDGALPLPQLRVRLRRGRRATPTRAGPPARRSPTSTPTGPAPTAACASSRTSSPSPAEPGPEATPRPPDPAALGAVRQDRAMSSGPEQSYRVAVRSLLRERLLDAAAGVFSEDGWRRLTMAKVAERAGVSRQTVYNEFGNKQQLAEQLIHRELDQFLDAVHRAFVAEETVSGAVRAAVLAALEMATKDDLLVAVLEGGHSGDTDLLPFIFQSRDLVDRATDFVYDLFGQRHPDLLLVSDRIPTAMESLVRLVLSHVSQPTRPPAETADDLTWIVDMVVLGALAEVEQGVPTVE